MKKDYLPSITVLARIVTILFFIGMPGFVIKNDFISYIHEYWGIVWHFALFFLITKLPVPSWGKMAGYAWIILDILAGVLFIQHFPYASNMAVRYAGHLFQGLWFISSSLVVSNKTLKICSIMGGSMIGIYTLISPFVSESSAFSTVFLGIDTLFLVVWYIFVSLGKYSVKEN